MLYQVLKYRSDAELQYKVISLGGGQYYEELIRELGYVVVELAFLKKPVFSTIRLCREIKNADTLCCWMYHANLVGFLAGRCTGVPRIVWCVRHSDLSPAHNKARTLCINRICARLSKKVTTILYNGNRARLVHEAMGYCPENGFVVDNGCDSDEYAPDESARDSFRKELGIQADNPLVLSVTKDTPIKDVPTFLKAISLLRKNNDKIFAVLCGPGVDNNSTQLAELCQALGLKQGRDVAFLGMRHDVPRLLAACDLYVLHSAGEAFPNALIQAMSCGCLCITTDVGDARRIINNDEFVVPPEDSERLARKIDQVLQLSDEGKETIKRDNRERAKTEFNIKCIVKKYEAFFDHD